MAVQRAWPEADFHVVPDAGHAAMEPDFLRKTQRVAAWTAWLAEALTPPAPKCLQRLWKGTFPSG